MEVKKSPKADLEKSKSLFFLMGLVVALAFVFTAFEWGSRDISLEKIENSMAALDEEEIEITPPEENTPPPPPPAEVPPVIEELKVVDNDKVIQSIEMATTEDNNKSAQVNYAPPSAGTGRDESVEDNQIFDFLEEMPEFPGGNGEALSKWLSKNVNYPPIAAENNIQGRVQLGFVVEKDGSVTDVKVLRPVDPSLDKEAVRVVKSMPKWKPGMQTGKPVRCRFTIPVTFRLR